MHNSTIATRFLVHQIVTSAFISAHECAAPWSLFTAMCSIVFHTLTMLESSVKMHEALIMMMNV